MTKWEYLNVPTRKKLTGSGFLVSNYLKDTRMSGIHGKLIEEAFTDLGNDGWELVSSYNHGQSPPSFVFKRPLG
jgi:hypothetical protein